MHIYQHPDNLVILCEDAVKKFSGNKLFGTKNSTGEYEWITYKQFGERVNRLRAGMAGLGIGKGDMVGSLIRNSVEWAQIAFAAYGLGAHYVPLYENESQSTIKYIINDCKIKILFIADLELKESIKGIFSDTPSLSHLYIIRGDGDYSLKELEMLGGLNPVEAIHPTPYDMAGIIYTSGTTADPKGVMLTHGNFTACAMSGYHIFPELEETSVSLSILPWAHSYGQSAELYNWFLFGGSIGFASSVDTIAEDILKVKPTFLIAVPRIFNKIYDGLHLKMMEEGGIGEKLFRRSKKVARKKRQLAEKGKQSALVNFKYKFYDKIVFSKIREKLGGNIQGSLTASATMNIDIAQFFFDIGIPVYDCYGLTETAPAVTMNCAAAYRLGTVGKPVENVKVVIDKSVVEEGAEDGEIIIYGPNVMMGYYNKPEETAKVLMPDGGFRSGDRGRLDEDGYLIITGRIKEQYKLLNGKYVFPAVIEEDIKLLPYIKNAMIFGDGKAYNICIAVPDTDLLKRYAKEFRLITETEELLKNSTVQDFMSHEIKKHLEKKFKHYEIPKKFFYINDDFTLDNGLLTQTLKLKRRAVISRYQYIIDDLYTRF